MMMLPNKLNSATQQLVVHLRSHTYVGVLSSLLQTATIASAPTRFLTTFSSSTHSSPSLLQQKEQARGQYGSYMSDYTSSIARPEQFWSQAAQALEWFKSPQTILDDTTNPHSPRWFPDGIINTSYNCLDVHVRNGRGDQDAILYDSPLTNVKERITYRQLLDQVSKFAGVLQNELHVTTGDRVVIYMPMIPESIVAMLACARIGAIHSVVFGGFAAPELAKRIIDSQPKVVVSASAGVLPGGRVVPYKPLLDQALEMVAAAHHHVVKTVIVQRQSVPRCRASMGPNDLDYETVMSSTVSRPVDAVPLPANHPHFILYTSGTTGVPKGVVHDTGPSAVSWKYSMGAFYDTGPGEVFWTASDIGWAVGHAYIVYAPLLNGSTTVLYEGKPLTPDAGAFWRVIEEYGVKTLFTAPTALRTIRQADPQAELVQKYDLSHFQALFLAGEHSDPATLHWCEYALRNGRHGGSDDIASSSTAGPPAFDHWWQTELGYPGVGNAIGLGRLPTKYGACAAPVPGYSIHVLDQDGKPVPPNTVGNMVIKQPLPPGSLTTLYNNDDRFIDEYMTKFPGYYETGDAASIDDDGYVYIMGRTDDIINTAGHRLYTGTMEEILMSHETVAECAVIGVHDELKGEVPVGFVIIKAGMNVDEAVLCDELVALVRNTLGPIACFHKVAVVKHLPKTRSGKILRGTMARIANNQDYKITPTIEDENVFEYLEPVIKRLCSSGDLSNSV